MSDLGPRIVWAIPAIAFALFIVMIFARPGGILARRE